MGYLDKSHKKSKLLVFFFPFVRKCWEKNVKKSRRRRGVGVGGGEGEDAVWCGSGYGQTARRSERGGVGGGKREFNHSHDSSRRLDSNEKFIFKLL